MLAAHIMVGNPRIFKQCFEQVNLRKLKKIFSGCVDYIHLLMSQKLLQKHY